VQRVPWAKSYCIPTAWPPPGFMLPWCTNSAGKEHRPKSGPRQALRRKHFVADWHLNHVGDAYYPAGRPEKAIAPLEQYLTRYPNILGAHLTLAAVYSELGREAEARAEVAEVLRINPQFSLEIYRERVPIKDPAVLEHHIAALRKSVAGYHMDL